MKYLFVTIIVLVLLASATVQAQPGNLTLSKAVISVCTQTDLEQVRTHLDRTYVQTCNITLTSPFVPIGSLYTPFSGIYNGNGYSISNFAYHNSTAISVGLFSANNGTLANIQLVNVNVSGRITVGALAGTNTGKIISSRVLSGVVYDEGHDTRHIGGLVGYNGNFNVIYEEFFGYIFNSSSAARVGTYNTFYSGGLVGVNDEGAYIYHSSSTGEVYGKGAVGGLVGASSGNIQYSYASGSVHGANNSSYGCIPGTQANPCTYVGGLLGHNAALDPDKGVVNTSYATGTVNGYDGVGGLVGNAFSRSSISNSYASGSVYGRAGVGGLVGTYRSGNIQGTYYAPPIYHSYSVGFVHAVDSFYAGGLVGYDANNDGIATSSYWNTQTSGQPTSGLGIGKTTFEMRNQTTYVGWDFAKIWSMKPSLKISRMSGGYPQLR